MNSEKWKVNSESSVQVTGDFFFLPAVENLLKSQKNLNFFIFFYKILYKKEYEGNYI